MSTVTKNSRTVVTSTSNTAGSTTRGTLDLRTKLGGILTLKLTNGGTGPTIQCVGRILIAHNTGATPTAAAAGTDWKTVIEFGGGLVASAVTEWTYHVPSSVMHLEVEFTGNTGQAVTVEAFLSELTDIS